MRAEQITTTDEIWERVCIKAEEAGLIPAELAGLLLTYAVGALMDDRDLKEVAIDEKCFYSPKN